MYDEYGHSRVVLGVTITILVIAIIAFSVWWHRDTIFVADEPEQTEIVNQDDTEEGSEEVDSVPIEKNYLDKVVTQLFNYNGIGLDSDEIEYITTDNDSRQLANDLIPIVNNNSGTTKVPVSIVGQNLLYLPAPAVITLSLDNKIVPMLFVKSDEAGVTAYNPISDTVTEYPYTKFSKAYDKAGQQCVYIAYRGYSDY